MKEARQVSPRPCPSCGYPVDAVTALSAAQVPQDEDNSICIACGSLSIFCLGGTALRLPTPEERAERLKEPSVVKAIAVVLRVKSKDPNWPVGPNSPKAPR